MKVEVESLQDLMRVRKFTVTKLSEETGISEDTIRRRLKDKDWRVSEVTRIVKAMSIPKNWVYVYFFEPMVELDSKDVT